MIELDEKTIKKLKLFLDEFVIDIKVGEKEYFFMPIKILLNQLMRDAIKRFFAENLEIPMEIKEEIEKRIKTFYI